MKYRLEEMATSLLMLGRSIQSQKRNWIGWQQTFSLDQMMEDSWRWQKNNPEGYNQLKRNNK